MPIQYVLYKVMNGQHIYLKSKEEEIFPSYTDKYSHAAKFTELKKAAKKAKRMELEFKELVDGKPYGVK